MLLKLEHMPYMSPVGDWFQDPHIKECLVWRSKTKKSEYRGGDYGEYMQCRDDDDKP